MNAPFVAESNSPRGPALYSEEARLVPTTSTMSSIRVDKIQSVRERRFRRAGTGGFVGVCAACGCGNGAPTAGAGGNREYDAVTSSA